MKTLPSHLSFLAVIFLRQLSQFHYENGYARNEQQKDRLDLTARSALNDPSVVVRNLRTNDTNEKTTLSGP